MRVERPGTWINDKSGFTHAWSAHRQKSGGYFFHPYSEPQEAVAQRWQILIFRGGEQLMRSIVHTGLTA